VYRVIAGFVGMQFALLAGFWAFSGAWPGTFAWAAGVTVVGVGWLLWGPQNGDLRTAGLLALCVIDWLWAGQMYLHPRPLAEVQAPGAQTAGYLAAQEGLFRVYSPSYSLPQHTAARFGLELADGVDPLQLAAYADFMQAATGVHLEGYSVTLPPFRGPPATANASALPDPARLGLLNVRFVAAEFDLNVEGLAPRARFGETRVYENLLARPRAWVQPDTAAFSPEIRPVALRWQPNRVEITAEGPGYLVLSEIMYPGWRAWVDGQPAEVQPFAGLLRMVRLGPGTHTVLFAFYPVSVYLGLGLFLVGLWGWRRWA